MAQDRHPGRTHDPVPEMVDGDSAETPTHGGEFPARFDDRRVVALLVNDQNQAILEDWLPGESNSAKQPNDGGCLDLTGVDCVILDKKSFHEHRMELEEFRNSRRGIVPFLLVTPKQSPPTDPGLRDSVDEVIGTPIRKELLAWRLETLLELREKSLTLVQEQEHLQQIAHAAAHDLRNPLTVAQMHVGMLEESTGTESISNALDRMNKLVDNVLAVAKTSNHVDPTELEPVALTEAVSACWNIIPDEGATVDYSALHDLTVRAKRILLEQLVDNLLRNAVVHGPADVTIRVGPLSEGDGFVIEDDGPGIPPEDCESIFDSGYSTGSGSGIGLSVVERVCDAHDWSVEVEESEAGGARFVIDDVEVVDTDYQASEPR